MVTGVVKTLYKVIPAPPSIKSLHSAVSGLVNWMSCGLLLSKNVLIKHEKCAIFLKGNGNNYGWPVKATMRINLR